jgi:hypothetical protein
MDDNAIGALAVLCIFGAPVAALIVSRILAHRERMEMIRQGMPPSMFGGKRSQRRAARDFAAWSAQQQPDGQPQSGFGAMPPFGGPQPRAGDRVRAAFDARPQPEYGSPEKMLRGGVVTACIGFAITLGLSFIGYSHENGLTEFHPGPWLIGGLIPMFVGVAQIINAVLAGAQINLPRGYGNAVYRDIPPPRNEPPPWATGDPMQQPGRTVEQPRIARPVPPPDIRP